MNSRTFSKNPRKRGEIQHPPLATPIFDADSTMKVVKHNNIYQITGKGLIHNSGHASFHAVTGLEKIEVNEAGRQKLHRMPGSRRNIQSYILKVETGISHP